MNVVASALHTLSRPDLPQAEVRHIEPPVERETGRDAALSDLALGASRRAQLRQARTLRCVIARTHALCKIDCRTLFRPVPSVVSPP